MKLRSPQSSAGETKRSSSRRLASIALNRNGETGRGEAETVALAPQAMFDSALDSISQGICIFDQSDRLIYCNERYLEIFGFSADIVKPGASRNEILEISFSLGNHGLVSLGELKGAYHARLTAQNPAPIEHRLADGRTIAIKHRALRSGGSVSTYEDVTPIKAREAALVEMQAQSSRAENEARAAHQRLLEAIEMLPEAIVFMDNSDRFVLWNRKYAELYADVVDILAPGVSFEHVLRVSLARGQQPETIEDPEAWLASRLAQHAAPGPPFEQRFRDGRWVRLEERRTSDGGSIGMRVDITDLKKREQSFRLLFESNPVPMWLLRVSDRGFIAVNEAAQARYGYTLEQFRAMRECDVEAPVNLSPGRPPSEYAVGANNERIWEHATADGALIQVVKFSREIVYEGEQAALVAIVDVTERLRAEADIVHMAGHDLLTNMPNRHLFREKLEAALALARRGETVAILFLDIDRFKSVIDTLGHSVGDTLLRLVGNRLKNTLRETDVVARLGGDEFAVLHVGWNRPKDIGALAERLIRVVSEVYDFDGLQAAIGLSIGIAVAPTDGADVDSLLRSADTALYRAKAEGRGTFRFFEPEMGARLLHQRQLELDLRRALKAGEFELFYQPIHDLQTMKITTCEALLRWRHPSRGMVAPDEFIPVAEECGVIETLGEWVIQQACADAAAWPSEISVAVNLSTAQFKSPTLVAAVVGALNSSGLAGERLELEITESLLLEDDEATMSVLRRLRGLGARIALDDFGTGQSSLGHLRNFPFDKIKVDRSFVSEMCVRDDCRAIVAAIAGLGKALRIVTTAEGIETEEQRLQINELGCCEAQGYLFSRPMPLADLTAYFSSGRPA